MPLDGHYGFYVQIRCWERASLDPRLIKKKKACVYCMGDSAHALVMPPETFSLNLLFLSNGEAA